MKNYLNFIVYKGNYAEMVILIYAGVEKSHKTFHIAPNSHRGEQNID